jgi:hypothetical protein
MPRVEFEPTITVFERAKTVLALDSAATVIGDRVALRQVFSEYFGFPCQFSLHPLLHTHHHLLSGVGTIGQLVADVPSGQSHPYPHEVK